MDYINYLPLLFISMVFLKIYNVVACDEMSNIPSKLFVYLLTIGSLNLFITVWWAVCSHQRLQIIMIAIIILCGFSGFLGWAGRVLHQFKGDLLPLCWICRLAAEYWWEKWKINQEELTVVCHLCYVLVTVSLRFKTSPRAQRRRRQWRCSIQKPWK